VKKKCNPSPVDHHDVGTKNNQALLRRGEGKTLDEEGWRHSIKKQKVIELDSQVVGHGNNPGAALAALIR